MLPRGPKIPPKQAQIGSKNDPKRGCYTLFLCTFLAILIDFGAKKEGATPSFCALFWSFLEV